MKITSVELHPIKSSNVCMLSFRDPGRLNPYNVKSILGLDADSIVTKFYGSPRYATKFYNFSLEKREVVVNVELNPRFGENETFSSLRDNLYKLISSSRQGLIQVQFKNGATVEAVISGFITKFDATQFEKEQQVTITISCDDAMLRSLDPIEIDITGLDTALTHINDPLSTAPHGFALRVGFQNDLSNITIIDPTDPTWDFVVRPQGGFLTDDHLYLSSEFNAQYIFLERLGETIYLGDVITPGCVWPLIFPGDNQFSFGTDTGLVWEYIRYNPAYWGI